MTKATVLNKNTLKLFVHERTEIDYLVFQRRIDLNRVEDRQIHLQIVYLLCKRRKLKCSKC